MFGMRSRMSFAVSSPGRLSLVAASKMETLDAVSRNERSIFSPVTVTASSIMIGAPSAAGGASSAGGGAAGSDFARTGPGSTSLDTAYDSMQALATDCAHHDAHSLSIPPPPPYCLRNRHHP